MLLLRLLLVATLVSLGVAALVIHNERQRVVKVATDRVLIRGGTLRMLILEQLDAPDLKSHSAEIQKMLLTAGYRGYNLSTGHYVLGRVLDMQLREVARAADKDYDHVGMLERHLEGERIPVPPEGEEPRMSWEEVGGRSYIHAMIELRNSREQPAAYLEGFFVTTPEEKKASFWNLVRAMAISVGTVLATALLLYPLIMQLMRRLERLSHNLLDSNLETLSVIGSTIAKRDSDTDIHNFRVTIYSVKMAEALGLDDQQIRILIKGAFLHDVGKIGIRDNILLKPGRLDEAEFSEMKKHVGHGTDIVGRSSWLREAMSVVSSHHEQFSGAGYPRGLAGKDIPILARIFAIADVFDALTSHRPYKAPLSYNEAIDILLQGRGTHFDPEILDVFVKISPPLYERYGNKEDNTPREDLDEIVQRYYKADIATFLD